MRIYDIVIKTIIIWIIISLTPPKRKYLIQADVIILSIPAPAPAPPTTTENIIVPTKSKTKITATTSTQTNQTSQTSQPDNNSNLTTIIGILAASITILALAALVLICCIKRLRTRKQAYKRHLQIQNPSVSQIQRGQAYQYPNTSDLPFQQNIFSNPISELNQNQLATLARNIDLRSQAQRKAPPPPLPY